MNDPRLRLLLWSLLVAVTALSSVSFFADRVERALNIEGASVIAADLVVEQDQPMAARWIEHAQQLGLQVSHLVSFPSVLMLGDRPQLVMVKAVQANYPLRGTLKLETPAGPTGTPPAHGQAFVGKHLQQRLAAAASDLPSGDLHSGQLQLGKLHLKVAGQVIEEPDVGVRLFQLAPRLLINWHDAQVSGLLGPASRGRYRLLLAGSADQVARYRAWIKPRLPVNAQLLDAGSGQPELTSAIERGQKFLGLAALCASLVAGVAIMLATQRYVQLLLDEVAILRTLGMTSWQVLWRHLRRLLQVTLVGSLLGALCGLLLQAGLAQLFGNWFGRPLPAPGWHPWLLAFGHAGILVLGFSLPSLLALRKVPPLRVLRRELGAVGMSQALSVAIALGAYAALLYWQAGDAAIAGSMILVLTGALATFALAGFLVLRLLAPLRRRGVLALPLAGLTRQPGLTLLQLSGFGLAVTLLLLLSLVRVDILGAWQRSLPKDTPNYFLINILPDQVAPLRRLLAAHRIHNSGFYPSTRGRLVSINGKTVEPDQFPPGRARHLATREFNLGFGERLQRDNRVLEGHWWKPGERGFSVENGIADLLHIKLGDQLVFDVAGQQLAAPVISIRSVNWDSFNVNFFVQGSPAVLNGVPNAVISSIHLGAAQQDLLGTLAHDYPTVTLISVGPLLEKVREVVERGALAIEAVFLFTLLAALLVSVAAVQISREQRRSEIALLRSFGAGRWRVLQAVVGEFLLLGLLAGVLAALLSNVLGIYLAKHLFDLDTGIDPLLWLVGVVAGSLGIGLVGYLASRPLLRTPPMQLLHWVLRRFKWI